jgi:hypothetical protein
MPRGAGASERVGVCECERAERGGDRQRDEREAQEG